MSFSARLVSSARGVARSQRPPLCGGGASVARCFASSGETLIDNPTYWDVVRDLFLSYARPDPSHAEAEPLLCTNDLSDLLVSIGERPSDVRLRRIMETVDKEKSGTVELGEFMDGFGAILGRPDYEGAGDDGGEGGFIDMDALIRTFRTLDLNGDGVLSRGEINGLLVADGGHIGKKEARRLIKLAGVDGSGTIDLSEFIAFVQDPEARHLSWRLQAGFRAAFVIGGPQSGKSLLCDRLVWEAGLQRCDTGAMLREEAAMGSPLGEDIKVAMEKGWLVPFSTVIALTKKKLSKFPSSFVLLDGFPRSKRNCRDFEKVCGAPEFAVYIEVPEEVMMERILHKNSGQDSDIVEKAENRIKDFLSLAQPMLEHLYESGVPVHKLDGRNSPDEIWDQLLSLNMILKNRAKH